MNVRRALSIASALLAFVVLFSSAGAQDEKKTGAKPKEGRKVAKKSSGGRLPSGWSRLGITEEQRKKIYEVQARIREKLDQKDQELRRVREEYNKRVNSLKAEISSLHHQQDEELDKLLTEDQRKLWKKMQDDAKKRKEEAREKVKSGKTDDKPAKKGD